MKRALPALLLVAACSGGGGGNGTAPPPPPPPQPPPAALVAVSGLSPFAPACGASAGTAYINAEVEPSLAADPRDPSHLVATWQQDRWSNGSARGIGTAASFDGGTTWTAVQVPFSQCSGGSAANGGDYLRSTDPWVTFAPDGTVYLAALSTTGGSFTEGSANAVLVSRSADGGRTWSLPATLIRDTGAIFFNDKESITADPHDARFAYAVWDRVQQNVTGPTAFARTTDGGATWEAARIIYNPGATSQTIGNVIRVLPDGTLVNLFAQLDPGPGTGVASSIRVIRSSDRGVTWSPSIVVSPLQSLGTRDPTTGLPVRDGSLVPGLAVGPGATLHAVWQDARFTGVRDAVAYSRSTDGGTTWSAPVRVNGDPNVAAFVPQVGVAADGTVGVSYYDFRNDTPAAATLPTDHWLARSTDGVAWSDTRIGTSFDLATAPQAGGALFLGDYSGLEAAGNTFLSLHARTTGSLDNRTDIFLGRVTAGAAPAAAPPEARRAVALDEAFHARVSENLRAAAARRLPLR